MRIVISSIQQYLKNGTVKDINHVSSQDQIADMLTKKGVSSEKIIRAVSKGFLKLPQFKTSKWRKSMLANQHEKKN